MHKLRLDLDELSVESFATDAAKEERGTVEGFVSLHCTGGVATCNGGNTCDGVAATCAGTCYVSCKGSCPCYQNTDATEDYSCTAPSCVWTCTTCNQFGCASCD